MVAILFVVIAVSLSLLVVFSTCMGTEGLVGMLLVLESSKCWLVLLLVSLGVETTEAMSVLHAILVDAIPPFGDWILLSPKVSCLGWQLPLDRGVIGLSFPT